MGVRLRHVGKVSEEFLRASWWTVVPKLQSEKALTGSLRPQIGHFIGKADVRY
ncbi:hypothetical protein FHT85_005937 [Rhizobium sp. BK312]|nr:hypothetical protein [Rhizobium sp. BK312]